MAIELDNESNELATTSSLGNSKLKTNEYGGRVRMARFSYNTGVAGAADDDHIGLCRIPVGARILQIFLAWEAMGTTGALDLGLMGADLNGYYTGTTADDDDFIAAAIDISSAGEVIVADTIATQYGYETTKEVFLVATVETAVWAADKDIVGHVLYVTD